MNRFIKFAMPTLAMGLFIGIPSMTARADDPPATAPSAATGSITIKVTDANDKPVSGATVNIAPPRAPGARGGGGGGAARPQPLGTGTTDENGLVTIKDIAVGSYTATARVQGTGMGRADVKIVANTPADAAPVVIKLAPMRARNGGGGGGNGGGGNGGAGNGN